MLGRQSVRYRQAWQATHPPREARGRSGALTPAATSPSLGFHEVPHFVVLLACQGLRTSSVRWVGLDTAVFVRGPRFDHSAITMFGRRHAWRRRDGVS